VVPPPVALRPVQQVLAVVDETQRPRLDVGVEPLFDDYLHVAARCVGDAHVETFHVAAQPREIDLVARRAQPLRGHARAGAGTTLAPTHPPAPLALIAAERPGILTLALGDGRGRDRIRLILEPVGLDADLLAARH